MLPQTTAEQFEIQTVETRGEKVPAELPRMMSRGLGMVTGRRTASGVVVGLDRASCSWAKPACRKHSYTERSPRTTPGEKIHLHCSSRWMESEQ